MGAVKVMRTSDNNNDNATMRRRDDAMMPMMPTMTLTGRGGGGRTSEAAPCPLQPCHFDKWDLFADTWDCQYAMGFPVCIFKYLGVSLHNFIPIFPIS